MWSHLLRRKSIRVFIAGWISSGCLACAYLLRLKTDVWDNDPIRTVEYRGLELIREADTLWGRDIQTIREEHSTGMRCVVTQVGDAGSPFVITDSVGRVMIEGICAIDTFPSSSGIVATPDFSRVESAKSYSPDGTLIAQLAYGDGVVKMLEETGDPIWEMHYEHGQISRERRYHKNSVLASETPWRFGKPHGLARRWDEDGRIAEEGRYVDGERVGNWRKYDQTGAVIEEETW